ncbi:hypothetical protein EZS27_035551, partial [termite gut metagenome]
FFGRGNNDRIHGIQILTVNYETYSYRHSRIQY